MAKWRVKATHKEETVQFTVKDDVYWLWMFHGLGGITLSQNTVRIKRKIGDALRRNPNLIAHEAIHILQARKLGWKYLPIYIKQAIIARFRKSNIPMEQDAYAHQAEVIWTLE